MKVLWCAVIVVMVALGACNSIAPRDPFSDCSRSKRIRQTRRNCQRLCYMKPFCNKELRSDCVQACFETDDWRYKGCKLP